LRPVAFLRPVVFLRPVAFLRPVDLRAVDFRAADLRAAGLRVVLRPVVFLLPVVFLAANPGTSRSTWTKFLQLRLVLFGRALLRTTKLLYPKTRTSAHSSSN
jgi:hypothetical protein